MDPTAVRKGSESVGSVSYAFGEFTLDPLRRMLLRLSDGARVELASRAFNALELFVGRPGELLHKDWLMAVLWPGMVVDENNLSQVISTLRRALGDNNRSYIRTEARRGFRFVCPVMEQPALRVPASAQTAADKVVATRTDLDARCPKLAVLPFVNLDNDPAQDYFVAGMTEEVAAALTRVRSLLVIAGGTTAALVGEFAVPEDAARRLGVRYILQGSVRRGGPKIRIAVKLADAGEGTQIWAERFEGTPEDIFALQDRAALGVAGAIEPSVRDMEHRRIARVPPESLDCYDLYLRAAHLRAKLDRGSVFEALALLDRALLLDAHFAPALAQAAGCHSQIFSCGWTDEPEAHRIKGRELVGRALRACHDDASVLAQAANALMDLEVEPGTNIDQALDLIARATQLNPGSAFAWFISGVLHIIQSDAQLAAEHMQRAMQLDPISALHGNARSHLGLALVEMGRYEEALAILRAASNPSPRMQLVLACVSSELAQLAQARGELSRYEQMTSIRAEAMVSRMTRHSGLRTWMLEALARIRPG